MKITSHDMTSKMDFLGGTVIPVGIIDYIHYELWDEISFQFPNFNGVTVTYFKPKPTVIGMMANAWEVFDQTILMSLYHSLARRHI